MEQQRELLQELQDQLQGIDSPPADGESRATDTIDCSPTNEQQGGMGPGTAPPI